MMIVSELAVADEAIEVVERKGIGHPDTICDALAETLSQNLCREYQAQFGTILHHNVDKALLCGGHAAPAFGGGSLISPIDVYLAGRAVTEIGDKAIRIKEIAIEGSRAWLRANFHALDVERHVRIHDLVRPGSQDLQALFARNSNRAIPLANDTSFGVGYAPLSPLERLVLAAEKRINGRDRKNEHPAWGEDVKIMGIRHGDSISLTVACAMIDRHLDRLDDYLAEKSATEVLMRELAKAHGFSRCEVQVNAADDPSAGSVYLTVTGTSAEAGDDGEVGRGNRVNGLITPSRPMSLEAAAGKNPVSHVGKIYNVAARDIAETLIAALPDILAAQCMLVSRIGAPVTEPALVEIRLATRDGIAVDAMRREVADIVADRLHRIPNLIGEYMAGAIGIF
jgi:S-adenosylmethionine synthetase